MTTLQILWKRFNAESPAILARVIKIVLRLSLAITAAATAGLFLINQYQYKIEWKESISTILICNGIVYAFLFGLKFSTTDKKVQEMSDPETGIPVKNE